MGRPRTPIPTGNSKELQIQFQLQGPLELEFELAFLGVASWNWSCAAREPRIPFRACATPIGEHALQALWQARPWGAVPLTTRDGRRVRVVRAGRWSQDGGPDFQQAILELDGRTVVGDVELHVRASDWEVHGHGRDAAYARVALHVVLDDDGATPWTRGPGGLAIPKVEVGAWARRLAASAPKGLPEAQWLGPGACRGRTREEVHATAMAKGRERVLRRAAEVASRASAVGVEQAAWEVLAEGLGYARNAVPFLRLARRVPIDGLRRAIVDLAPEERLLHAEGVLLGAAGLLPAQAGDARLLALREAWFEHAEEWEAPSLPPAAWALGGTRPENAPPRRVAALAAYAAREGTFAGPWELALAQGEAVACLRLPADGFWSRRSALVGEDRARVLATNALAPLVLALAPDRTEAVLAQIAGIPSASPNRLTRLAGYRIFTGSASPPTGALEEQGRLQLAVEGCQWGREGCERCLLAWRR